MVMGGVLTGCGVGDDDDDDSLIKVLQKLIFIHSLKPLITGSCVCF